MVCLIIEVADSSLEYDRNTKKELYAEARIPEYWIVNIPSKQLEVFRQPEGSDYDKKEVFLPGEKANCISVNFTLEVAELFEGI